MEATTIDQLFPDVLEKIFSHLSGSDLKNCALVCKGWSDVIGSYATTMQKLKIGFGLDSDDISIGCGWPRREGIKMQSSDESHRKHQNVEILIRDGSLTQLPSLDRFNISQVKRLDLRFTSCASIELNKVMELLSRMPLLQVLKIVLRGKCTLDTSNAPVAHFPKLKQLVVNAVDQPMTAIFEFIKADNLTELTYQQFAEHSDAEIDDLTNFIKSKKNLSKLAVSEAVITQLLRRPDFIGMSLESLKVDVVFNERTVFHSDIVLENFRKSLISNASLTSLSIPSWMMSKKVRTVIFNRLRKLTTLEIANRDDDGSWMDDLLPSDISHNLSLQTLKVPIVGAVDGLKAILQRAPQLKKLSLGRVTDAIVNEVATSAPRLVELKVVTLAENLTGAQRFNELKSLNMAMIYNVGILASLLERCPKIEAFECWCCDKENPDRLIDILLQQKTLKHLRLNRLHLAARRTIFDKLKSNFGNLRSLELGSSGDKFIMFEFPENPAEWNIEEQEARFSEFQVTNPFR